MHDTDQPGSEGPAAIVDPRIAVRPSTLADGRELIYFDDADSTLPAERGIDERVLDPRPATAHMRQDPLTGEWISIAAARRGCDGALLRARDGQRGRCGLARLAGLDPA